MPLYMSSFKRINFGIRPPLKQTADVLLKTDIPFDDENLEAFEKALWSAMWEQNPHWRESNGPPGATTGWSSVLGGREIKLISENDNRALAWHFPQEGWLCEDGETATVDADVAGRFSPDEILALQARYPGERHSQVTPKLLSEIYDKDGAPCRGVELQLRFDKFVVWGQGPRTEKTFLEVALANSGSGRWCFEFELPEPTQYWPDPREYERVKTWGWRIVYNGVGAGADWHLAESKEAALTAARADAVQQMRSGGHHDCGAYLATKHSVQLVEVRVPEDTAGASAL